MAITEERRKYTEAFKREAMQLMETSGKAIAEFARDLGINDCFVSEQIPRRHVGYHEYYAPTISPH
jgi:hypothetical protein